jgi:hypothetical protein
VVASGAFLGDFEVTPPSGVTRIRRRIVDAGNEAEASRCEGDLAAQ